MPSGYTSVIVEQIVGTSGDNDNLELDFVGGDGEKTLGDTLHGIVLWRMADIKLIGNTAAPVDPPSPPHYDNDDRDSSPQPPSPPSPPGQRASSTPTPPAQKKRERYHPSHQLDPQTRSRKESKRR